MCAFPYQTIRRIPLRLVAAPVGAMAATIHVAEYVS
jgi:hypothetical protein